MVEDTVAHYKQALDIFQKDPVPWVLLYGAQLVISVFTFGLGTLLVPNVMRATRDALDNETAPDLGALFQFDDFLEDAIAAGGLLVVTMVGSSIVGPLSTLLAMLLSYAPPAVTEKHVGGLDALQLSANYVIKDPVPVILHGLSGMVLNLPGLCCFFPLFVTLPITGIAHWLLYQQVRDGVLQIPAAPTDG